MDENAFILKAHLSNIDFTTPLSINVAKIFFRIIKIIGPINIPNIPMNL